MGSVRKLKGNRVILEKTAYFVGRFLTKDINDVALEKLRDIIRLDKGYKTKLRLGVEGISSGHRFTSALLKNRLPYDFIPLVDIVNILQDTKYKNLLLFVVTLTSIQYEIVAFRTKEEKTVLDFIESFTYVTSGNTNYTSNKLWRYISNVTNGRHTQSTYSRNTADFSFPNRQVRSPSPSGSVSSNVSSKSGGRLYRRDPSPVFDGNVYQRAGSYRWNSHVYSRHHRRTFKPSDVTSTATAISVQWVRDFQVQVHSNTDLPVDIRVGNTFAVKSYSHVVRIYIQKGTAVADVSCQTKTVAVVTHQDIHTSNGHSSRPVSKSESVKSNSLASESFRRQVNELTQEVKELRHMLKSKPSQEETRQQKLSAPTANNTNAHGHRNGSETSSLSSLSNAAVGSQITKTPPRVAWSPRLEQFAFDSDGEVDRDGPGSTSTPRSGAAVPVSEQSHILRNSSTVSGYFMRTTPPAAIASMYVAKPSSAIKELDIDVKSEKPEVFDTKQLSTVAGTSSRYNKRPSIFNIFRSRSKSPAQTLDNNENCLYKTKIDIKSSRGRSSMKKIRPRSAGLEHRSSSASATMQGSHKSVLYLNSGGTPDGHMASSSGVARQTDTVYLPKGTGLSHGGTIQNDEMYPTVL